MLTFVRPLTAFALFATLAYWLSPPLTAPAQEKAQPAPATKWEYKHIEKTNGTATKDIDAELNKLGDEGWELVVAFPSTRDHTYYRYVLKRPKR